MSGIAWLVKENGMGVVVLRIELQYNLVCGLTSYTNGAYANRNVKLYTVQITSNPQIIALFKLIQNIFLLQQWL